MARKKKLEEDAWLWMSRPVVASMSPTSRRGTSISSYGSGLSVKEWTIFQLQQQSLAGGMFPAFLYYGQAGLADPKAPVEAYGYGGFLGLSGWRRAAGGALMGGIIGFAVGGAIGVVIDPMHKWEGGYDETSDYQQFERDYGEMKAPWKTQYTPTY